MPRMLLDLTLLLLGADNPALAQNSAPEICPRPVAGSTASDPEDLSSDHGVLKVTLKFLTSVDSQGHIRYCYIYKDGAQAPTLRVNPGDTLILNLENDIAPEPSHAALRSPSHANANSDRKPAREAKMTASSTNLHFHGLMIPPVCHQDDVLHTVVGPSAVAIRISLPDSSRSAARPLLVSPAPSRFHQRASARRSFRSADRGRHRAGQSAAGRTAGARPGHSGSGIDQSGCAAHTRPIPRRTPSSCAMPRATS